MFVFTVGVCREGVTTPTPTLFGPSAEPDPDTFIYMNFMKTHTCYDAIPTSSKLVIFDTTLQVGKTQVCPPVVVPIITNGLFSLGQKSFLRSGGEWPEGSAFVGQKAEVFCR